MRLQGAEQGAAILSPVTLILMASKTNMKKQPIQLNLLYSKIVIRSTICFQPISQHILDDTFSGAFRISMPGSHR